MKINVELLKRFKEGKCSAEEIIQLEQYFNRNDFSTLENTFQEDWNALEGKISREDSTVKGVIWNKIQQSIGQKNKVISLRQKIGRWGAIAATIALLIVGYKYLNTQQKNTQSIVEKINHQQIPMMVELMEGTKIWLKPKSRITYPSQFSNDKREVSLKGEAYFEVQSDKSWPFLVKSKNVITRVLGTTFNISAFPNRPAIEIALLEGSVAVDLDQDTAIQQIALLQPGESFTYQKNNGQYIKANFEDTLSYLWKDGIIYFERASIKKVVEILENWYSIKINLPTHELAEETLKHKVDTRKMDIDEVIAGINLVMKKYTYVKTGSNTYTVESKK